MRSSRLITTLSGAALLALSCGGPGMEAEDQAVESIPRAGIFTNGIFTNGIFTNGIFTNGIATNSLAAEVIINRGLDDAVLDPTIRANLEDSNTKMFMRYLVSCALKPTQAVTWNSLFSSATRTWKGEVGLCPEWETNPPTQGCRERVSACLLARNNAFGVTVAISMRGQQDDVNPIAMSPKVMPWKFRWRTHNTVASAKACPIVTTGLARNCGWKPVGVGVCTPGTAVTIDAGCGGDAGAGNTMLRVCRRVHFCDAAEAITASDDACGFKPKVSFICPAEGTFALLKANFTSSLSAATTLTVTGAKVPGPEIQVFKWREGGFYGDLFAAISQEKHQVRINPAKGNLQEQIIPGSDPALFKDENFRDIRVAPLFQGVIYPKMFSCSSKEWNAPAAYYQRRVCAGPLGEDCAAQYVGPCFPELCGQNNAHPADFDYKDCADSGGGVWKQPITTFLNQPCDLVANDPKFAELCTTVGRTPIDPPSQ